MTDVFFRNVRRLRQMASDRLYQNHRPARLGQYAADGTIDPDLSAGGNYLWVRQGVNGERGVTRAINAGVNQAYPDAPVIIAERSTDGSLCIISVDFNEETNSIYGENLLGASMPVIPSAADAQPKDTLLLTAGRVTPSTVYPSTLYVYIAPFWSNGQFLGGVHHDVGSANVPGTVNQRRWCIICVDSGNDTYTLAGTAAVAASVAQLVISNASTIVVPVGYIPVGLITLSYGQTDISESRFVDARYWLSPRTQHTTSRVVSADETIADDADEIYLNADASGGTLTLTLPLAAAYTGRVVHVTKTDSSGYTVTVDGNGAETINGDATLIIQYQWSSAALQSNGTGWFIT